MESEVEKKNWPEKSARTRPLPRNDSETADGFVGSFQAAEEVASSHSLVNAIVNRSAHDGQGASSSFFPKKEASYSKDIGPPYDPHLLMLRRMVCSEHLTRSRLTSRNENIASSIGKSTIAGEPETDEVFFERMKKRICENIRSGTYSSTTHQIAQPRRRKRRGAFSAESLNLMKKFRAEVAERFDEQSSAVDNGNFSLASKPDIKNGEKVAVPQTPNENDVTTFHIKTPSNIPIAKLNNLPNCETDDDDDFRWPSPIFVRNADTD